MLGAHWTWKCYKQSRREASFLSVPMFTDLSLAPDMPRCTPPLTASSDCFGVWSILCLSHEQSEMKRENLVNFQNKTPQLTNTIRVDLYICVHLNRTQERWTHARSQGGTVEALVDPRGESTSCVNGRELLKRDDIDNRRPVLTPACRRVRMVSVLLLDSSQLRFWLLYVRLMQQTFALWMHYVSGPTRIGC